MKRLLLFAALLPLAAFGQNNPLLGGTDKWSSVLTNLPARNLGPTTMGGRITDISVYEKEPRIFYAGSASGGLWKTVNGGITLQPVFEKEVVASIGAVAVCQTNPDLVWVGTGEPTSRNSSSWGAGVFKSEDGGKTWKMMGLPESRHISRIAIDPRNPDTVFIGALGQLWGANEERGLYKTTDGGKSWKKVLSVDSNTGVVDVKIDPSDSKTLIAATWQRLRFPWNFISGGPGSAIWKSTDGGESWRKVTKGLPTDTLGRIGLDFFRKDPKIVVATVESKEGGGFYKSKDKGESWARLSNTNPRPFYFSVPRQDPQDENRVYVAAVQLYSSDNGGELFRTMRTSVHVDHHAMWIDPNDSNHMLIGEDGGLAQTRDRGDTWEHLNMPDIGQFYAVAVDMRKPYWVYGGLQDNGSWGAPTQTSRGGVSYFDWINVGGGDGFHVQVDPEDWATVYSESQGGAVGRIDLRGGFQRSIRPRGQRNEYRFNWSTPFIISPHNAKTLYLGGNKLFKSVDRGDNWNTISDDLTTNDPEKQKPGEGSVSPEDTGAERHCTIITISESPAKQGLLWVGTDDGLVHISRNDGVSWENVVGNISGLPANTWCSRVTASAFEEGRAYATFDGHRSNDYKPYVYVTEDFGKTWKSLAGTLPAVGSTYVIKEGTQNPDLLFVGTETGLFVSLDRGENWTKYAGLPTVPVHDLVIHPRELDLVIGTHGRSIWIVPVGALEQLTTAAREKDVVLCKPADVYLMGRTSRGGDFDGDRLFVSTNTQPGTMICYYLKAEATGVKINISDAAGNSVADLTGTGAAGLNAVSWTGRGRRGLAAGDYRVTLTVGENTFLTSVRVEDLGPLSGDEE
ncbi:MAG: hypothetical protein M9921_00965 [Fimbriimonadaceae bacterium]|nr:hypothetical protein [Fimbriimonadaceae bacterium]